MKTTLSVSIVLFAVLFGSGCTDESTEEPTQRLEFTTVENARRSAITELKYVTVKDANSWNELWAEHTKNFQPPPDAPLIDFNDTMVLGVFLGSRPTTCYSVTIETVEQVVKQKVLVKYREEKSGGACGQAFTQPLHLISLKTTDLPVEFVALQ